MITVLFFASLREQMQTRQLELVLEHPTSVRNLATQLEKMYATLTLSGSLCAVNENYAEPEHMIHPGDTVAFFPPVSGG